METDYFFHSAFEQDYFFLAKIRARNFFSKKTQAPPEYQMDRALQSESTKSKYVNVNSTTSPSPFAEKKMFRRKVAPLGNIVQKAILAQRPLGKS